MRSSDVDGHNEPTGFLLSGFFFLFSSIFITPPVPPLGISSVHFYGSPKAKPTGLNSSLQ
jgi:hypothetical protein